MKLILLRCPQCNRPLKPENDDVVIACDNCFTPVAIGRDGPSRITVHYAVLEDQPVQIEPWYPFWVFSGKVNILRRETQGGRSREADSAAMWGSSRRLYVPAWELSMRVAQEVGSRLVQEQSEFRFVQQPSEWQLVAATVTPGDARNLLEFVILAIEARRKDWLKDLEFSMDLDQPEFWVLQESSYE